MNPACTELPETEHLVEPNGQGTPAQGSGADTEGYLHGVEHLEGEMPPGFRQ
jgi:hypothetical protein